MKNFILGLPRRFLSAKLSLFMGATALLFFPTMQVAQQTDGSDLRGIVSGKVQGVNGGEVRGVIGGKVQGVIGGEVRGVIGGVLPGGTINP